ncbi:aquaporin [Streptomyces sp. C11-1]|uniref:Aquaporin n=1 Tax=Streptomyces durocortorensis TaxID=2811104 RepID=A0ABY9VRC0_9ACTN|nr:aquaporin [Streptomyces durocortorensis]WNF26487.1 aquaporin [Streptomyces durocortorensis]
MIQTVPVPVPVVEIVPLVPVVPPPSDGRPAPQPSYDPLLPRAVCEFALTALLLFLIVSSVRWLVGPDPAAPVAHPAVLGCVVGTVLVLLLTSPPGRRSGGHLNPAVTLALWRLGAFPGRDVVPYAVGQLAGSVLGAWLGGLVWGPAAVLPPVRHASVRADPAWGGAAILAAEAGVLAGFTLLLAVLLGSPGGRRLLPYAVGLVVALVVAVLGPLSGGSANPARQFGPALLAGDAGRLWVYLLGPVLGAVLGAWLAGWVGLRRYR